MYLLPGKFKPTAGKLTRWTSFLMAFDITIIYKPGKENLLADCFSRNVGHIQQIAPEPCDEIRKLQEVDEWCAPTIKYLESDMLPEDDVKAKRLLATIDQYHIEGQRNLLFCIYLPSKNKSYNVYHHFCVPDKMIKEILYQTHDSMYGGGHQGITRTIREYFFFGR